MRKQPFFIPHPRGSRAVKGREAWREYAADFNAMSDEEIEEERTKAQYLVDEQESWLEAVASWEAAGKPRGDAA
jgi:hypothetical protein